ncbi:MAG: hypothetical protein IT328_10115 [Caldilineaceae bacterium]|nr:hypothetical protein [Caldilineaceae bacterium]
MQRGNLLKRGNRSMVLVSLFMAALVLLVGCAPRATSGAVAASADESQVVVDLPALVLDVQPDGSISVGGQPLTELGGGLGASLAAASVPADMVDLITAYNIQHIQIDNTAEGLLILVNGQAIPSLAWDGEKLVATAEVLDTFGAGVALLDRVLPLLTNLGVGVIIRFPLAAGEEPLPLVSLDDEAATRSMAAQQEFLAAVGTPPTFQLTVEYAADGTWTVADLASAEWSQLVPGVMEMLTLTPGTVQSMSAAGISEIGLATNSDGIFISINGKTLPYITWADGRVNHLLTLAEQTGLLSQVIGDSPDMAALLDTVEGLLPAVQASDVSLRVTFP